MKLKRLSVTNFRGIKQLSLALSQNSAAVIGANGTGKSSIADALDFLLTGSVRRLTGEGAGGITLSRHGTHIDAEARNAFVEAEFTSVTGASVVLKRCVASPEDLHASGSIPDDVARFLEECQQGAHHLLTRREILRYILTEPSKRLEQVAALLQLTRIDTIRKEIQGAAREALDAGKQAEAVRKTRHDSVLRSFNPAAVSASDVLAKANGHRVLLGGAALARLDPGTLRDGVTPPAIAQNSTLQSQRTRELLVRTVQWLDSGHADVAQQTTDYLAKIAKLRDDAEAMKSLRAVDLLTRGLRLIDGDECPLCLNQWPAQTLKDHIRDRLSAGQEAERALEALREQRRLIQAQVASIDSVVRSLGAAIEAEWPNEARLLNEFASSLAFYVGQLLIDPVSGQVPKPSAEARAQEQLTGTTLLSEMRVLTQRASVLPDLRGVQQAWDELAGLDRAILELREARGAAELTKRAATELGSLDKLFLQARDEVLQSTYDGIAERLTELYRRLHGEDEESFAASMSPTKAGLKLEVDFFGRGAHPPCALHSEGHQDSMGVCLFLALTERLTAGHMPILILDDVLMSVDDGHRRAVAELLREQFADVQLIITTHDRVWWRQLQSLGVVKRKNAFEIRQWSIQDGPVLTENAGMMLSGAEEAVAANDVARAAHQLRRAVEIHFRDICDGLGAAVRFRGDGNFGAGDFVMAANKRIAELLKLAKKSANSWSRSTTDIDAADAARIAAAQAFQEENWAVNPLVHYNERANLSVGDFRAVLDAYRALFAVYLCNVCGSALWITESGATPTGMRCACGDISYNLLKQEGALT